MFSNLVLYNPSAEEVSLRTIVPEAAERWAWSPDGRRLTFTLHPGARWHDGRPLTAATDQGAVRAGFRAEGERAGARDPASFR
ncbi:MAG: PD40 domain-containing protein [Candidatus Lambdaproteobacteria bacterium]|nr:PD40 domain-containing protein [Candidatus Lambdaproteobacteria bacterium]